MLNAWGAPLIKQFVEESIRHAVRLEQALSKLQTERRIVLLHYSPIRGTLKGEYPEIFVFLRSSRLEKPINRFRVNAVFHGYAHNGILDGKTSTGIPVYNVSAPALRKTGKLYRVVELEGVGVRRQSIREVSQPPRAMLLHRRGLVWVKHIGQLSTSQT